ncbi:hypothetical protein GYMLUDRAFT_941553 [Collybiopsis luxurians FD-317 M1]|uniref:Unplaced genomic scaffold GYMLUscaffold_83, whole genome shotgun sequence n=1 Tax=Collybiopsis luxurians FD-317 M1 TaxID=944289 RepID=A0A0D0AS89_9AGAR|nr:hypothetical protein GYMLUDRAFT_941553 [Collybiopsis luxurians FD-317 M1]
MDWPGVSRKQFTYSPDAPHFRFSNFTFAAAAVFIIASTLADTVLLYRAYTLWDRQLSIVLAPVVLLLSSVGAGIYALILAGKLGGILSSTDFPVSDTTLKEAKIGTLVFAGSTLVVNLILTGLIVYRVRQCSQITNKYLPSSEHVNNKPLVKLIMGSCLLYPIAIAALYGGAIGVRTEAYFVGPILAQIMGISPTFMIVEIDLTLKSPISGSEHQGEI